MAQALEALKKANERIDELAGALDKLADTTLEQADLELRDWPQVTSKAGEPLPMRQGVEAFRDARGVICSALAFHEVTMVHADSISPDALVSYATQLGELAQTEAFLSILPPGDFSARGEDRTYPIVTVQMEVTWGPNTCRMTSPA